MHYALRHNLNVHAMQSYEDHSICPTVLCGFNGIVVMAWLIMKFVFSAVAQTIPDGVLVRGEAVVDQSDMQ